MTSRRVLGAVLILVCTDAFQAASRNPAAWVRLNAEGPRMPPSKELMNYLETLLPADPTNKLTNDEKPYNVALKTLIDPRGCAGDEQCAVAALTARAGGASSGDGESSARLDFLEASPYYDTSHVPLNTFKAKAPFVGKVNSVKRIVGPKANGEICHVNIEHKGEMPFWEGQSVGVIPPGVDAKGKPNKNRLYSIASSRYGDEFDGRTVSLCVRRATFWDEALGAEDPSKKGVCSNYLCDATLGTDVKMTGPSGKVMLLPEATPEADIIMVATGTGVAPFRAFWKRLFVEKTPAAENFKGLAWLFLGVANREALLYDDELQAIAQAHPAHFKLDYALSREQTNAQGGKMYIQDKVEEYADDVFERLDKGAHMYFCGLKGMMPGVLAMLEVVCAKKGLDFKEFVKGLKERGQWHVEVY